ncbi:MAG: YdcF family protein [Bacteroidota bacterium]|nr:YdcF family protein [Bacteroidota bacterium]MDP3146298.1 YdcF family protein [Bacteroidota bacterium]
MFFFLSKILAFIISPVVWVFGLLVYAFKTKNESRAKKTRITAIIILYVCCNSFVVDECFRQYEPVTPDYDLMSTKYDGAIILGGIGNIDVRLKKINFGGSADRLFQILPLYYKGRVKKLIFTGGSGSIEFPESKEGIYIKKYLKSINIPDSAMIIESESKNTFENAVFTKKILDSLNFKGNFLLVTSAYHMPRSLAVFKKAGFTNITPYITNKSSGIRRYSLDHLFIPNPDALFSLQLLIHEWLGFIVYKIRGYA